MSAESSPKKALLEEVKNEIHSILCTSKGSVTSDQLLREYQSFCGDSLPLQDLGFENIQELLQNIPDVVSCNMSNGSLWVRAIERGGTFINNLVQGQKAPKRHPNGYLLGRTVPLMRNPIHPSSFKNGFQQRPAAPWNNQFHYQAPTVRSHVVVPPNSTIRQPLVRSNSQHTQQTPTRQIYQPPHLQQRNSQHTFTQSQKPPQGSQQRQTPSTGFQPTPSARTGRTNEPVKSNTTYREKLERFAQLHNLGEPTYENAKQKNNKYVATVIVDKKRFNCYPAEFSVVDDAYEKAAEEALSHFELNYQENIKKMPVTTDIKLMAKRVVEIVSKNSAGYWGEAFLKIYTENYKESLPKDWIARVKLVADDLEFTTVPEAEGGFLICMARSKKAQEPAPSSSVPATPDQSISEFFKQPEPKAIESRKLSDASNDSIQSAPQESYWMVHVLVVYNVEQVAIRRIDSDQYDKWEELQHQMEVYYTNNDKLIPVRKILKGRLYAVQVDTLWVRVELIDYEDDHNAKMMLVDYEDIEIIPVSSVYPLEDHFNKLPPQGMKCRLFGLSSFSQSLEATDATVKHVLDCRFVAHIVSREPQLTVMLYESSSGSQININERILEQLAESAASIPLKVGPVMQNSAISYVSSACDIYMLRDTPQQNVVHALVSLLELRAAGGPIAASLIANSVYLGRSEKHGWCRMRLYSNLPTPDGNVSVQLIDYGDTELVPRDSLRDLQKMSPILARIPDQAFRILLARVPPSPTKVFTDKAAKSLRQIAPPNLSLMVRVLEFANSIPVVELFERLDSGKLVTINASLEMDETLYRSADQSTSKAIDADVSQRMATMSIPSRKSSTSSSPSPTSFQIDRVVVPEAEIPPVDTGRFMKPFDVRVFNVSNPGHFYVQPLQTMSLLSSLERRLKEFYNQEEMKTASLDPASLIVGGFYAAVHSKSQSYRRVQVNAKYGELISATFIDCGEMELIQPNSIRPLLPEFANLPSQAMKAQLYGVKPADGDWSTQNALFFKTYVDEKVFASYVMRVNQEDKTLCLQLIDVTGKEDVALSAYLVENFHAIAA